MKEPLKLIMPLLFLGAASFSWSAEVSLYELKKTYEEYQKSGDREKFAPYLNQKVTLTAFAHRDDKSGRWFLTAQPRVRSCCLGTGKKAAEQIAIDEDISLWADSDLPIHLEGTLVLAENPKNNTRPTYLLIDPKPLQGRKNLPVPWGTFAACIAALSATALLLRRGRTFR